MIIDFLLLTSLPDSDSFLDKLIPNFWAFLIQLLALIVMIVAVVFFLHKPVQKMLDKRKEYIDKEISDAELANIEANKNLELSSAQIEKSKKEANTIILSAQNDAKANAEKIRHNAHLEAEAIKKKAESDIEDAKLKAKEDIHKEIVDVALEASKHLLSREVTNDDNKRLIDDFINEVNQDE